MATIEAQFKILKSKHSDAVILFRCGDFYGSFYEDADTIGKILGITVTSDMRQAGFPYHVLDTYLPRLIRAGKRVAICDELRETAEPAAATKKNQGHRRIRSRHHKKTLMS